MDTTSTETGGYELLRLHHPKVEDINDDFLCCFCLSKWSYFNLVIEIVKKPMECGNEDCAVLYCASCIEL